MASRFRRSIIVNHSPARPAKHPAHTYTLAESMGVRLELDDAGNLKITDKKGNELPPQRAKELRAKNDLQLKRWLHDEAELINEELDTMLKVYHDTPAPDAEIVLQKRQHATPILNLPTLKPLGVLGRLFKSRRIKIEQENQALMQEHNQEFEEQDSAWMADCVEHEKLSQLIENVHLKDIDAMGDFLEQRLSRVNLLSEVNISFDITTPSEAFIDVIFPQIENIPSRQAAPAKRGYKLNIKNLSTAQNRNNYANYIHGIGFRIVGEYFHALPPVIKVTLSGYTQQPQKKSGKAEDQCLYSVAIDRDQWQAINFTKLYEIDIRQIFEQFDLRRSITKTGLTKPIEPFSPANSNM